MIALGIGGFGVGAGARALTGLGQLAQTKAPGVPMTSSVPTTIHVPAALPPQPEEEMGTEQFAKVAAHPLNNWWGIPAATATATVGLGTGWKAIDWMMQQRKKRQLANQLSDAKDEFDTAMRDQYAAAMAAKTASDAGNPFPELDELFDAVSDGCRELEKQAEDTGMLDKIPFVSQAKQVANTGAGMYLTALLGAGALGAYGTYNWAKNRNKEKALRQAIELRARQRMAPQPLYATPVPIG